MRVSLIAFAGKPEVPHLDIGPGQYIFGRSEECQARIGIDNKQGVSRRHCLLTVAEQTILVRDLRGRNGTGVNSMRIGRGRQKLLHHGDRLSMGSIVYLVKLEGVDVAKMPSEPIVDDTGEILCRAVRPFPDETVNVPPGRTKG